MQQENSYRELLSPDSPVFGARMLLRCGSAEKVSCAPHWHDETEVVLAVKGGGIQQVNQNFFPLAPGEISVICPRQLHSFRAQEDREQELLVLQFDPEPLLETLHGEAQFCREWRSGRILFDRALPADGMLRELILQIRESLLCRDAGSLCAAEGALRLLLAQLYRCRTGLLPACAPEASESRGRRLIDPAVLFLTENYRREDLTVEKAAAAANLSVTHFCRLFRQAAGMGFHEYLNRFRVLQAEKMFPGRESLTEIAFACGFGSTSAFLRNYRRYRGITPQQARGRRTGTDLQEPE